MGYKQGVLKKQTSSSCNNIKNVEANEKNEIKNPDLKMVRKCCATDLKSNHLSEKEKVSVYWLTSDSEEQQKWIKPSQGAV